jgi:hypothetical protein
VKEKEEKTTDYKKFKEKQVKELKNEDVFIQ